VLEALLGGLPTASGCVETSRLEHQENPSIAAIVHLRLHKRVAATPTTQQTAIGNKQPPLTLRPIF
jgi:hypothetical protein